MLKRTSVVVLLALVGCTGDGGGDQPPRFDSDRIAVSVVEDGSATIDATGSDPSGGTLTYAVTTQPSHGTISGTGPVYTYAPAPDYFGDDTLTVTLTNDAGSLSVPVDVTVTSVDDAPTGADQSVTTNQRQGVAITLAGVDVDDASEDLVLTITTPPAHGTITGHAPSVTYTPDDEFSGEDSFQYGVSDGTLSSSVYTISISVTHVLTCGDGVAEGSEQCDDGDEDNTDGCLDNCMIATCGDGFVESGVEACDDGNVDDADACLDTCAIATCGDGAVQAGVEQCDQGALNADTGSCLPSCVAATCGDGLVQAGVEQCDQGASNADTGSCLPSCVAATCGDGLVLAGVEQCDEGTSNSDTGSCLPSCVAATCGDGFVQIGVEQCDQGVLNSNTGSCLPSCQAATCGDGFVRVGIEECDEGVLNSNAGACLRSCRQATCGDGFVRVGVEQCDNGSVNGYDRACLPSCQVATCGDGFLQTGVEQCDLGAVNSNDGSCLLSCRQATCGDSFVRTGVEQCDQGASNSDTGACLSSCAAATCGDGFVRTGVEQCDDGNTTNDDACTTSCREPTCGDGLVEFGLGEECDDENVLASDGCDGNCLVEPYTTTTAVLISDVLNCTTQPANQTRKVAVDGDGRIYAVYTCGSSGFVSVSTNRGQTFSSPFDLSAQQGPGGTELAITQIAVATGGGKTAYAALQDASANVFLRTSTNFGASWGPLVPIGTASNTSSGVSLQAFNDMVFVGYASNGGVAIASSRDRGATFASVWVAMANPTFDLSYDVRGQKLALTNSSPTFEVLLSSDDGRTWSPPFTPPGMQFLADWAMGNGLVYAVGTQVGAIGNATTTYVISFYAPGASSAIGGLPMVHVAQSRSVTANDRGDAFVSSMLDTSGVQLDRLPFDTTAYDVPRTLTATGTWPNAAPLPGGQGVVVIYTESGSQVWATVQSYAP